VARATGGLVQQVVPHATCMKNEALLSLYGRQLVPHYHVMQSPATGILYREQVSFADEVEGWRDIVDCGYWEQNPKGDRIHERQNILLFQKMVSSAVAALRLAIGIYADQPQYAAMIFNGWQMLANFSWQRAVASYRQMLYQTPC